MQPFDLFLWTNFISSLSYAAFILNISICQRECFWTDRTDWPRSRSRFWFFFLKIAVHRSQLNRQITLNRSRQSFSLLVAFSFLLGKNTYFVSKRHISFLIVQRPLHKMSFQDNAMVQSYLSFLPFSITNFCCGVVCCAIASSINSCVIF